MTIKRYGSVFAAALLIGATATATLAEAQSAAPEPSAPGAQGNEDEDASRSDGSASKPACQTYGGRPGQMFVRGDIGERQCAINYLRASLELVSFDAPLIGGPLELAVTEQQAQHNAALARQARTNAALRQLSQIDEGVGYLRDYYALRARRQQMMVDVQAGIVFVAALGAAAASGTPASSQRVWAYTAFAPVLTSQVNANEPTRNLFHGGGLALDLLSARYAKLIELRRALGPVGARPDCSGSDETGLGAARADVRSWSTASDETDVTRDDRTALLADADRLAASCRDLVERHDSSEAFIAAFDAALITMPLAYGGAALSLDQSLLARDRQLRYSPAEMVSAVIASPLRTLDSLLTGQSAETAINTLKTQVAFAGLSQELAPIRLPPTPGPLTPVTLSNATEARSTVSRPRADHTARFTDALTTLENSASDLRTKIGPWNYRAGLMAEIAAVAEADTLRFQYDSLAGNVTITLGSDPLSDGQPSKTERPPVSPLS